MSVATETNRRTNAQTNSQCEGSTCSPFLCRELFTAGGTPIPQDVRETLGYLEGMFPKLLDRRMFSRWRYFAQAAFADYDGRVSELWLRDLNRYNTGFVTRQRLETGTAGPVSFDLPGGGRCEIRARVMRCREILPGWFEGYLNFADLLSVEVAAITRRKK